MGAQDNQSTQETVNGTVDATPVVNYKDTNFKGNEDRKIFVGGIPYDVTNEDLVSYFSKFGEVTQAQVKFDWTTGRSRGFAFVEFATCEACKNALNEREQYIKNKQCEIKPAKSREKKKVFVGGLPADHPEEELRKHFEQYGKVEDIEWPFDKQTKARRNFAFIVFEEEEAADRAASISKQTFGNRECDVKKAVPQNKRNNNFLQRANAAAGAPTGIRPVFPYRNSTLTMHNPAAQNTWYSNGWPVINAPNGYAPAAAPNNWPDWYKLQGNSAAYAQYQVFDQSAATNAAGTGAVGVAGIHVNCQPNGASVGAQIINYK